MSYIYCVRSSAHAKIGYWSGSVSALRTRYSTYSLCYKPVFLRTPVALKCIRSSTNLPVSKSRFQTVFPPANTMFHKIKTLEPLTAKRVTEWDFGTLPLSSVCPRTLICTSRHEFVSLRRAFVPISPPLCP